VRVVEYNSSSSLYEQLLMIRDTGVYISVHTSNLANSPLLQPGSAVIEIIQVGCTAAVHKGRQGLWWAGRPRHMHAVCLSCGEDDACLCAGMGVYLATTRRALLALHTRSRCCDAAPCGAAPCEW
jgi:hypothetical protein